MMNEGVNQSSPNPMDKAKQDALFENREPKKIIRIITVMAYMTSVSFVGIVLSGYYIFLWHPPNPRLMHSQAQSAHHEARVDFLVVDDSTTLPPPTLFSRIGEQSKVTDDKVDLLAAMVAEAQRSSSGSLKTRREIVKNVNSILRANFERSRSSEAPTEESTENSSPVQTSNDTFDYTTSAVPLDIGNSTGFLENNSTSATEETSASSDLPTTEETTDRGSTQETGSMPTALTPTTTTRLTRSLGKKQHQTPFALKHLEVPIKNEGGRRKSLRFAASTMRTDSASSDTTASAALLDKTESDMDQMVPPTPSPEFGVRDLLKVLSIPKQRIKSSATDYPQPLPSISSDQFQAAPMMVDEGVTTESYSDDVLED